MIGDGKWDIQPAAVNGILGNVGNQVSEFTGHVEKINTALSSSSQAAQSSIIGQALSEFGQAKQADVEAITGRINNAVNGAQTATQAYVNGDLQMAANAHAGMSGNPVRPPMGGETGLGGRGFGAQPQTDPRTATLPDTTPPPETTLPSGTTWTSGTGGDEQRT